MAFGISHRSGNPNQDEELSDLRHSQMDGSAVNTSWNVALARRLLSLDTPHERLSEAAAFRLANP
jgi:hypothetical protein